MEMPSVLSMRISPSTAGMPGQGRERAQRQAEKNGEQHRRAAKLQRHRQEMPDDVGDDLRPVPEGGAEVAMQRAPEIVGILLIERVVEMVFGVEDRLDLGFDRPVRAAIPRRPGRHMGDEEDHRIDEQQGGNAGQYAPR